jgi:hypothetical protein
MFSISNPNEEANRQIEFWQFLKKKIMKIYNDDPDVNIEFLQKCYDNVYDYIMYENRKFIEMRNLGKQQFSPGTTHETSRELYYMLIGLMNDRADDYARVRFNRVESKLR